MSPIRPFFGTKRCKISPEAQIPYIIKSCSDEVYEGGTVILIKKVTFLLAFNIIYAPQTNRKTFFISFSYKVAISVKKGPKSPLVVKILYFLNR